MKSKFESLTINRDKDFPPLKNDLIFKAINGDNVSKTPVWIMRQAGRYLPEFQKVRDEHDFFTVCRTPELACQVTLQPIERYGTLLDASIIFCDILVVPQAMGMQVEMLKGKGPHFPEPLNSPDDISKLKENVDVGDSLNYLYEAIKLTRTKLEGRVPLFGFVGAPWTLMAYMIEGGGSKTLSKAKGWLFKYPKESHQLLQRISNVVVDLLVMQVKAGAQMLQVFESWGGDLSEREFNEFSLPYLNRIAEKVKAELKEIDMSVPMFVFARGSHYALKVLNSSPYDVISLDWTISPRQARQSAPSKTLQGNADPCLLYAPKNKIRSAVQEMVSEFGKSKYIANLGHGMYPDHDPEQLKLYLEAIVCCINHREILPLNDFNKPYVD